MGLVSYIIVNNFAVWTAQSEHCLIKCLLIGGSLWLHSYVWVFFIPPSKLLIFCFPSQGEDGGAGPSDGKRLII